MKMRIKGFMRGARRIRPRNRRVQVSCAPAERLLGSRFWIPTGLSIVAISITAYQFYYANMRDVRRAYMSILAAEHVFVGDRDKAVLSVKALITNSGTTPIALQQVMWTLSERPDPNERNQRRVRWLFRPHSPIVVQARSMQTLDFSFASHDSSDGDWGNVTRALLRDAPHQLRIHHNFNVVYWSSLTALTNDVDGDLYLATLAAGTLGFAGGSEDGEFAAMMMGDFRKLPLKLQLVPSRRLTGFKELRDAWLPAPYENFENPSTGMIDTSGWRFLTDEALYSFRAWADSGAISFAP